MKMKVVTLLFVLFLMQMGREMFAQNKDSIPRKEIAKPIGLVDTVRDPNFVKLPAPYATRSVEKVCNVIGWKNGNTPKVPAGFKIKKFADGLENPRWIYVAKNGDVFISEASSSGRSANRITIFKDERWYVRNT